MTYNVFGGTLNLTQSINHYPAFPFPPFPPYYFKPFPYTSLKCVTENAAKMVVQAFISSRLDYCNSLLGGTASNLLQKLQSVQNVAA